MIVLPPVSLPMALLGLPHPSLTALVAILGGVVLALWLGAIVASRPPVKARIEAGRGRAVHWIDDAIAAWEAEGRLAGDEADRLREELREPGFVAVLPHFGVHLAIGVALRFPIGSITRGLYVLANMGLAHARFAARRTDYPTFRRSMSIHSPLVLVLTCMPGIGTFAYLASKPFRSHHLLTRVALDAVLLKLPKDVYERSGTRPILTRPAGWATRPEPHGGQEPGLRLHVVPARLMAVLTLIALGLFAIDVGVTLVDEILSPSFLGWEPVMRILDLNAESSFGTWFAVVMLLLLAVVLALIARGKRASGDGFALHWAGLAVIASVSRSMSRPSCTTSAAASAPRCASVSGSAACSTTAG